MRAEGICGDRDRVCGYLFQFAGRQGPVLPPNPRADRVTPSLRLENSTRKYTQYPQTHDCC